MPHFPIAFNPPEVPLAAVVLYTSISPANRVLVTDDLINWRALSTRAGDHYGISFDSEKKLTYLQSSTATNADKLRVGTARSFASPNAPESIGNAFVLAGNIFSLSGSIAGVGFGSGTNVRPWRRMTNGTYERSTNSFPCNRLAYSPGSSSDVYVCNVPGGSGIYWQSGSTYTGSWTSVNLLFGSTPSVNGVKFINNTFFAYGSSIGTGKLSTSVNGSVWTSRTFNYAGTANRVYDIGYSPYADRYFAACQVGQIYSSSDGNTWDRSVATGEARPATWCGYSDSLKKMIVIDDRLTYVYTSIDGASWEKITPVYRNTGGTGFIIAQFVVFR